MSNYYLFIKKYSSKLFLLIIFLHFHFLGLSQIYFEMQNGVTENTCSGIFTDDNGPNTNYSNNLNQVYTLCPTPGSGKIQLDFTLFDVETLWDGLNVYDGLNTASPQFISPQAGGSYDNNSPLIGTISASASNPSGCLTFEFFSDGSVTYEGWEATISCVQPCQSVLANLVTTNPVVNSNNEIKICQGESVSFVGSGTYNQNGTYYSQSDITSIFLWDFGDGTTATGTNVSHAFSNSGAYTVELTVTDVNGCESTNTETVLVLVSTTPVFAGTTASPTTICLGQQSTLTGVANPISAESNCNPSLGDTLELPDGLAAYTSCINLSCYSSGQTLTDPNDLLGICLEIEHSYIGDLSIEITCPTGQSVIMQPYGSLGGTYLGIPVDDDNLPNDIGVPWNYCFSDNATLGTWNTVAGGYTTLPAGTYNSYDPLSGLVGCELNGDWCITITDHLLLDNGFIYSWNVDLNPALIPPAFLFTPVFVTQQWQPDPSIISTNGNNITVEPTSSGSHNYTFEVIDDFGCTYDTTISINVLPLNDPNCSSLCSNTGIDTQVACNSYTWIDGVTYTSSNNIATYTLTNQAGCDSVVTLDLTINNSSTVIDTQVACDSYTWIDGVTYTTSNNTATFTLTNQAGCDSVVNLNLTINNSNTGIDTQVACDSYTWIDGVTYTSSNNIKTYVLNNSNGCDSIVTLNLTINNSNTGTDTQVACNSYTWIDGVTYTSSNNTATFTLTNQAGCDSVVTLDLTINNSNTGRDIQVACVSYTWIDGVTYTSSNNTATYTLTNQAGCDSVVTLDLTINNSTSGIDAQIACNNYTWIDGVTYTTSNNTATHTLINQAGCDSIVTLDLTINNSISGIDTQVACNNYTWIDGVTYTTSNNTATYTLTNQAGCDSLVILDLSINNSLTGTDTQIACNSYTWIDGITYTTSNSTATHTLTSSSGCDSVVTLDLTINNSTSAIDAQIACNNYTWIDGITYNSSNNTATFTLTTSSGCDSLVTLDLTINNSNTGTDTQIACNSFTWIDGATYTTSNNTATYTLTNQAGCDSLVALNLTINNSSTVIDSHVACDGYTWIDGVTYTASNNTATYTLTNQAGCDSVVTLDLTINNSSTAIDTQVSCDSYTWIDGVTYTTSNNTANYTLTNQAGCDSIVTLNLTINNSSIGIDTQVACNSYTWIDGITYTSNNNTATFTLTTLTGCDSLVTLDLTINNSNTGTDTQIACDSFTWIDGTTYTTSNNTATYTLTNQGGCDSLVTLNLTINNSSTGTDTQIACNSYTWIDGVTYTTSNNTATYTLTNSVGCDSIVSLNLIVSNLQSNVQIQNETCIGACDGYIDANITGGLGSNTYTWSHANLNIDMADFLCSGNYSLSVVDSIGCVLNIDTLISGTQSIFINQLDTIHELCNGDCTGQVMVHSVGATLFSLDSINYQSDSVFTSLCGGNYVLYLTDSNSCKNSIPFTITSPPPLYVQAVGDTTICMGGIADVSALANGGTGNLNYFWNDVSSSSNLPLFLDSDSLFCVSVIDANGCRSDSDCVMISVNPQLSVSTIQDHDICIGDSVAVSLSVSGGDGGPYNYVWTPNLNNDSVQILSPNSTTGYTVSVSDNCETPTVIESFNINVFPSPTILFSGDKREDCLPLTTNFTSSITPIGSNCLWNFGDGTTSTVCDSITHVFTDTGCFDISLTVTSPQGCISNLTDSQYVCVYDYPIADFFASPSTTSLINTFIEFYNTSQFATNYLWEVDVSGQISSFNQEEISFTFPNNQAGTYPICLTAINDFGCESTYCDEIVVEDKFLIYAPNAFSPGADDDINNIFAPVIYGADENAYHLMIFNRNGELIYESHHLNIGWNGEHNNKLCPLGVYVWKISVIDKFTNKFHEYIGNVTLVR